MAVLINMEIPLSCNDCRFVAYGYDEKFGGDCPCCCAMPGEGIGLCSIDNEESLKNGRPDWCPLEPIWESAMGVHVGYDLYRKVNLDKKEDKE